MENKRGLSGIIVAILLILLALVAAGIVWGVIRGTVESGAARVDLSSKCLEVDVETTQVDCTTVGICNVTVMRNAGGEDIGGVKVTFTNDLGQDNYVHTISGNIDPLDLKTDLNIVTGIADVTEVSVLPYFLDSVGQEELCPQ